MLRAKPLALITLLFALTAELLRASGPLLDTVAGDIGTLAAAGVAVGLFCLPGALVTTLRQLSLPILVLLLLVVRLLAQVVPSLPIVGAGAVLAMATLGIAVQRAGAAAAATGLIAGGALDLAVRAITRTWDPMWIAGWGFA